MNKMSTNLPFQTDVSIVVPGYRSATLLPQLYSRLCTVLEALSVQWEIILVDDASPDMSWGVIQQKAKEYPEVIAVDFLHNYGQHVANLCGFSQATGEYVITMGDDLQNPPEEIRQLIDKAAVGYYLYPIIN